MDAKLEEQVRVSKMLGVGFACSILGIGGIGSLIALVIGLRAKRIIQRWNGELNGINMAVVYCCWCLRYSGTHSAHHHIHHQAPEVIGRRRVLLYRPLSSRC
jgi:hypothetical protein